MTVRSEYAIDFLRQQSFDLVLLSPGPGKPADFKLSETIAEVLTLKTPIFGVCLGLQGLVEHFGGSLDVLPYPMHGKASTIHIEKQTGIFAGLGSQFIAGRYHSLYARLADFPKELEITALSEDGIIMAIAHKTLPINAVQFHPETILSLANQAGLRIISNLMGMISTNA